MRIEIEDYNGSTVVTLDFPQLSESYWELLKKRVEAMSEDRGFNVADYEDYHHMRLQHVNPDETEADDLDFYRLSKWICQFALI